ncbi:hypothetical protein ACWEPL_12400 [Nonomuraea sp. NPDC004186]
MIWRLTLECGHLRLDGPWGDDVARRMIGGITMCDVCPRRATTTMLRQVVNVESVPVDQYRRLAEDVARARMDALREW